MLEGKKTYIGIAITVLGIILGKFGHTITADDQAQLVNIVSVIMDFIGPVIAIYGRAKVKA
jgi:uncharacterized membrane protein